MELHSVLVTCCTIFRVKLLPELERTWDQRLVKEQQRTENNETIQWFIWSGIAVCINNVLRMVRRDIRDEYERVKEWHRRFEANRRGRRGAVVQVILPFSTSLCFHNGVCVCASHFLMPWHKNFVFGMIKHLDYAQVKLKYQGHKVKFKVIFILVNYSTGWTLDLLRIMYGHQGQGYFDVKFTIYHQSGGGSLTSRHSCSVYDFKQALQTSMAAADT